MWDVVKPTLFVLVEHRPDTNQPLSEVFAFCLLAFNYDWKML